MKWINVKDELPDDFEDVLFVAAYGLRMDKAFVSFGYRDVQGRWYDRAVIEDGEPREIRNVRCWAALPEPPAETPHA